MMREKCADVACQNVAVFHPLHLSNKTMKQLPAKQETWLILGDHLSLLLLTKILVQVKITLTCLAVLEIALLSLWQCCTEIYSSRWLDIRIEKPTVTHFMEVLPWNSYKASDYRGVPPLCTPQSFILCVSSSTLQFRGVSSMDTVAKEQRVL